jgi:hypothetical protein
VDTGLLWITTFVLGGVAMVMMVFGSLAAFVIFLLAIPGHRPAPASRCGIRPAHRLRWALDVPVSASIQLRRHPGQPDVLACAGPGRLGQRPRAAGVRGSTWTCPAIGGRLKNDEGGLPLRLISSRVIRVTCRHPLGEFAEVSAAAGREAPGAAAPRRLVQVTKPDRRASRRDCPPGFARFVASSRPVTSG